MGRVRFGGNRDIERGVCGRDAFAKDIIKLAPIVLSEENVVVGQFVMHALDAQHEDETGAGGFALRQPFCASCDMGKGRQQLVVGGRYIHV